ncbi:hypothetical protein ACWCPF_43120 [Streptomyces sp. NPDC001858]
MTENIEQHAQGSALSFAELVRALQERGIEYPLEAYRVHRCPTRCAGEMRTEETEEQESATGSWVCRFGGCDRPRV